MSCATIRDRLLDHVYGALEERDEHEVRDHLRDCAECRASLAAARGDAALFAEAARADAAGATFLATAAPRRFDVARLFSRRRLAAAAALLVACGAAAFGWHERARVSALRENPHVSVLAPRAIAPGQPPEFLVAVADADGAPLAANVIVDVSDGTAGSLATKTVATDADGKARVVFGSDLGAPGALMHVSVAAEIDGGVRRSASTLFVRDATQFLARIATDKPLYRPGETVRMRAVALDRFRLTPVGGPAVTFQVLDPRGAPVATTQDRASQGVAAWEFRVPDDAPGGEWKIALSGDSFPKTERTFVVRSYRVPRIKGDLELSRDSFGPGDAGEAWLSVERAEGGVPVGAACEAVVTVDGAEVSRETIVLPASGRATVKFTLPKDIREGRGQVAVVVRDGGNVETVAKTLPIVLDRIDVAFFPEGGDLVAGLPNRVYFRAEDPKGDPADLEADVVDADGRVVARAHVDDRGMGRFELTPTADATYRLVARKPATAKVVGAFPSVAAGGVTLRALDDVAAAGNSIRVELASSVGGRHTLSAFCRGAPVAQDTVTLAAGRPTVVELKPTSDVGGVVRVTVFDDAGVPRAERLVSLAPPHRVDVDLHPSSASVAPGDSVRVDVTTRDELGRPVAAVLGASVVDDAVLALAKDEDTPSLPMHFLLALDVEELEKCDVFAKGPNAARAVDRLLGVQGWRRFAWKTPATFLAKQPEKGPRVVLASANEAPQRADNLEDAKVAVASAVSHADRAIGRTSLIGATALAFVGLVVLGARTIARTPVRAVVGAFAVGFAAFAAVLFFHEDYARARRDVEAGAVAVFAFAAPPPAAPEPPQATPVANGPVDADGLAEGLRVEEAVRLDDFHAAGADGGKAPRPLVWARDKNAAPPREQKPMGLARLEAKVEQRVAFDEKEVGDFGRKRQIAYLGREFVHHRRPNHDGTREDFAEVLYWNPLLVTGVDGHGSFAFETSDSVTTFSIGVDAHDGRGALASTSAAFRNRVPFFLEPKTPVALSSGDRLLLPVVVANDTDAAFGVRVALDLSGDLLKNRGAAELATDVAAKARGRALFELVAGAGRGDVALTLTGTGPGGLVDRSVRTIPVVPRGYPIEIARGGLLEKHDVATISLPADLGTLEGSLAVYPSTLATLVEGLDSMLQEPCGCFEQASSSNYPNVLVLNYLGEAGTASPAVARRAKELLAHGYERLTGYECKQRGYEWFGGDPGHEALSAYGLMEFADMAKVHAVDAAMVARTRDWLLARRDGAGGFTRNDRALDTFGGAPKDLTDAYIVWSLTEADATIDLAKELAALEGKARASDDPYLVALAANALANRKAPAAKDLLARLASMQKEDGRLVGKTTSITSSSGANLDVETTSLAVMAFVREPARLPNAERAVRYLAAVRKGGGFGATQATILALRALTAHAKASKHVESDHAITLRVNGRIVGRRDVAAGSAGAIEFTDELVSALRPGENRIEIDDAGKEALPWSLALRYRADVPASDADCAVSVTTKLAKDVVAEGETVRLDVTIANRRDVGVPMTLARVGLPAGLEPRPDQLKELKEKGALDFYETRPREITLYFRGLAPHDEKRLALDLVAAIPGTFEGPATSGYLYYADDRKTWTAPLRVRVDPR